MACAWSRSWVCACARCCVTVRSRIAVGKIAVSTAGERGRLVCLPVACRPRSATLSSGCGRRCAGRAPKDGPERRFPKASRNLRQQPRDGCAFLRAQLILETVVLRRNGFVAALTAAFCLAALPLAAHAQGKAPEKSILVFGAASLKNALDAVDAAFAKQSGIDVVVSYDASSALMKQIEQGAPADIFISADQQWMDYGAQKKLIDDATRVNLLGNKLVLIAGKDSEIGDGRQRARGAGAGGARRGAAWDCLCDRRQGRAGREDHWRLSRRLPRPNCLSRRRNHDCQTGSQTLSRLPAFGGGASDPRKLRL